MKSACQVLSLFEVFLGEYFKEYFRYKCSNDFYDFWSEVAYIGSFLWMKQISQKKKIFPVFPNFLLLLFANWLEIIVLVIQQLKIRGFICLHSNLFNKTSNQAKILKAELQKEFSTINFFH